MGQTVKGMSNAMKSMNPEKIAKVMDEFEKSFENMDVQQGFMEGAMVASTATATPPDQVESLMKVNYIKSNYLFSFHNIL